MHPQEEESFSERIRKLAEARAAKRLESSEPPSGPSSRPAPPSVVGAVAAVNRFISQLLL